MSDLEGVESERSGRSRWLIAVQFGHEQMADLQSKHFLKAQFLNESSPKWRRSETVFEPHELGQKDITTQERMNH